jgi:indolepyruvate ferredoxin oxidoreductase, beta subunit
MNVRPNTEGKPPRREPLTLLIAALGGQGGGVLADWIGYAARAQGLTVQATSTPGVSQRTGATAYYIELAAMPEEGAAPPVLALTAVPGCVDILVCAEMLEAARMLERGMSTPKRTTVIASTHRVYTAHEKMNSGDGRFDSGRIGQAVRALARQAVLFDMEAVAVRHGAAISAVLFGALAGSNVMPVTRAACEDAIRSVGRGVAPSLAAFAQAFALAQQSGSEAASDTCASLADGNVTVHMNPQLPPALAARIAALPRTVAEFAQEGVARLLTYQDARYASRYLLRVERIVRAETVTEGLQASHEVAREVARFLALWMCYGDLIQVASLKARLSRLERIRGEVRARAGEVVRVYDLFQPSLLEITAILPRRLGAWLERHAGGRAKPQPSGKGIALQASSLSGALALHLAAALRSLRPYSLRFAREQEAIDDWLAAIGEALAAGGSSVDRAVELARLPRLRKGYGATHDSGVNDFQHILDMHRAGNGNDPDGATAALRVAVQAALERSSVPHPALESPTTRAQPVFWSKPSTR